MRKNLKMSKINLLVSIVCFYISMDAFAQDSTKVDYHMHPISKSVEDSSKVKKYKNEISLNTIAFIFQKLTFGYERAFKNNNTIKSEVILNRNDYFSYSQEESLHKNNFTVNLGFVSYFSDKHFQGFYMNPYLLLTNKTLDASPNNTERYLVQSKYLMGGGFALGYKKTYLKDRLALKYQILGVDRNFIATQIDNKYVAEARMNFRMGIYLGLRF